MSLVAEAILIPSGTSPGFQMKQIIVAATMIIIALVITMAIAEDLQQRATARVAPPSDPAVGKAPWAPSRKW